MNLIWDSEKVINKLSSKQEFFIRQLLLEQEGIVELDNRLYYQGLIEKFRLDIILRSGDQPVFPYSSQKTEDMLFVIKSEVERSLRRRVGSRIHETWDRKIYEIFLFQRRVLEEDFEKTQLGTFFYLLYLQERFKNDPNICVMISQLSSLIRKASELENDLSGLDEVSFKRKHSTFAPYYDNFIRNRREDPLMIFRLGILYAIVSVAGPYLFVVNDKPFLTKSFRILFERCRNSGARYTISLANVATNGFSHSTVLIIDNQERIIERYDPNGYSSFQGPIAESIDVLDQVLIDFGGEIGYDYLSPVEFCPRIGIQEIESRFSGKIGFCLSWSIIYAEERLQSDLSREEIAEDLLSIVMNKYQLNNDEVEDWLNQRIDRIFTEMDQLYIDLSQNLGVPVRYVAGRLVYEV